MTDWPKGYGRLVVEETDSTNAEARRTDHPPPVWIAAHRQTAGRGRSGRRWTSARGNLLATLLLAPTDPPAVLARRSFHASLAVADLVRHYAPSADVRLKWPNDVLVGGAKISGILLESFEARGGAPRLAIGIGINLAVAPPLSETRLPAVSLAEIAGIAPAVDDALDVLADALARWLDLDARAGFAPVREAWLASAAALGTRIEARLASVTLTGRFEDVDADGALVLLTETGRRRIAAADIHLPE